MSLSRRHLAALALAAALTMGGCGAEEDEPKGDPLPGPAVTQLDARLQEVQRRYRDALRNDNPGACEDIQADSFDGPGGIREILAGLPGAVDPDLRSAVRGSFDRLEELTREGCAGVEEAPPETVPVEPVPEEPVPEETVPEETTPEETVPEDPEPEPAPPPQDNGNGGAAPGGGRDGAPGLNGNPGQGGGAVPPEGGE